MTNRNVLLSRLLPIEQLAFLLGIVLQNNSREPYSWDPSLLHENLQCEMSVQPFITAILGLIFMLPYIIMGLSIFVIAKWATLLEDIRCPRGGS